MKRLLFLSVLAGVWFIASSDAPYPRNTGRYTPYYMERSELERSVSIKEARPMENPGKIWIRDNDIFIVERYKGVHIIDNSIPSHPEPRAFIVAPGCMDIAVKGDLVYLDNAVDLVVFDLVSERVTERLENHFPPPVNPEGRYFGTPPNDMILVGWKDTQNEK